jgi:hypothetical protein
MHRIAPFPGLLLCPAVLLATGVSLSATEPQAIDPFGRKTQIRDDALPGYLELSDGTIHPGHLFLTRDARLKIFDSAQKRFREVPLRAVRRIDCTVAKEWMEKEWRFKENASDVKVYTGRAYPVREYLHTITLREGRRIRGPLSGIVYVQQSSQAQAERYLLHQRDKGPIGSKLKALVYVRSIQLGEKALKEGQRRARKKPGKGKRNAGRN